MTADIRGVSRSVVLAKDMQWGAERGSIHIESLRHSYRPRQQPTSSLTSALEERWSPLESNRDRKKNLNQLSDVEQLKNLGSVRSLSCSPRMHLFAYAYIENRPLCNQNHSPTTHPDRSWSNERSWGVCVLCRWMLSLSSSSTCTCPWPPWRRGCCIS